MSNWKVGPGGRLYHPTTGAYVGQLDDNGNEQMVLTATLSDGGIGTLPDPASATGSQAFLSQIGVGGSYWYSDGVRWRPVGGSVLLHRMPADVIGVAGTTSQLFSSAKIPAGLMKDGDILRVTALFEKLGATDALDLSIVAAAASGTPTGTALVTMASAIATSGRTVGTKQELQCVSATEILPLRGGSFGGPFNGASSTLAPQAKIAVGVDMDSSNWWLALVGKMGGSTDVPKATTFYVEYVAG